MSASIIPTSSPRSILCFSLSLFFFVSLSPSSSHFSGLFSIFCHRGMASILPVVQHVAFALSLPFGGLSALLCSSLFRSCSFVPLLFLYRFLARFYPSDHPCARPTNAFSPWCPRGTPLGYFQAICFVNARNLDHPRALHPLSLSPRRLPRNLRPPRTQPPSAYLRSNAGLEYSNSRGMPVFPDKKVLPLRFLPS